MPDTIEEIRSLNDLRTFIHHTLCEKENLLEEQFEMTEMQLFRRGRDCGVRPGPRFAANGLPRFSLARPRSMSPTPSPQKALTPRQLEVLELLAKGLTNGEIGSVLHISVGTAKPPPGPEPIVTSFASSSD